MNWVLHISDTHFGTEVPAVVDALLQLAWQARPQLVVLSGDVTQRARRRQFTAAAAFVKQLGAPASLVIPGNHDIPLYNLAARIVAPYRGFARAFGAQLEPEYADARLLVLGVNTTRPWRHKHGELSDAQVRRVAARLRGAQREQMRLVVLHQPAWVADEVDRNNLLRTRGLPLARALRRWAEAGADAVLSGHIHLAYAALIGPAALGEAGRSLLYVQAGTAVSHRVRAGVPNSVFLIGHDGRAACEVQRWEFYAGAGRFRQMDRQLFGLAR